MFSLLYTDQALKQLDKLEKLTRERIILILERIRTRPNSYVKKLVSSSYFRLRVGDYRVILDIKNDELIILVIEVGHRKNSYKR